MALIADIADAVVAALNGQTFSMVFAAERAYLPSYDLKDMRELRVTVVPRSLEMTTASREATQHDLQIDVAVQKKLATADNAEIDALAGLVQQIAHFIAECRHMGSAAWVRSENTPVYSVEHLGELRQFTSVLTMTFRAVTT